MFANKAPALILLPDMVVVLLLTSVAASPSCSAVEPSAAPDITVLTAVLVVPTLKLPANVPPAASRSPLNLALPDVSI